MRGLRRWKNDLTSISTSTSTPPDSSSLSSASCTSKAESWQSGRGKGGLSFLRYGQPSRALRCSPYFDMHNTGHPRVRISRSRPSPSAPEPARPHENCPGPGRGTRLHPPPQTRKAHVLHPVTHAQLDSP